METALLVAAWGAAVVLVLMAVGFTAFTGLILWALWDLTR